MKLERMTISNFKQYYGQQVVVFSTDPQRNVTVINGVNGSGKTSFFLALNWVLYGVFPLDVGEMVNKRAMQEAPVGRPVRAEVALIVRDETSRYAITRYQDFVKQSDSRWTPRSTDLYMAELMPSGRAERLYDAETRVESWLPANVRIYFFFDGEKINEFAKPDHEDEVRSAIRNVMKIELLDRTYQHLSAVFKDINMELQRVATGRLKELADSIHRLEKEKSGITLEMDRLNSELKDCRDHIEDVDSQLLQVRDVHALVERRALLESHSLRKEEDLRRVRESVRERISQGAVILAAEPAKLALDLLDEKRKRGEIPSGIREQFLKDLLSQRTCICGRDLADGSDAQSRVEELLKRTVPSDLENEYMSVAGSLRVLVAQSDVSRRELRGARFDEASVQEEIEQLQDEIHRINREIRERLGRDIHDGGQIEHPETLEQKRDQCKTEAESILMTLGRMDHRLEELRQEISELESQKKRVQTQEERAKALKDKSYVAQAAAEAVHGVIETLASQIRAELQEKARDIFGQLVLKTSQFKSVDLTDDYRLEVLDRWGHPARPELSAGERQVLSLAFIAAMSRVAGEEAPLVMDTPFGRLSSQHRRSIAEHLPRLSDQLVLLVQDEELTGKARDKIEPRIGAEYILNFEEETGCTTVHKTR